MAKNAYKVKLTADEIYQDGNLVGEFQGTRSEVWVVMNKEGEDRMVAVARFKYLKPKTSAKALLKAVLQNYPAEEFVNAVTGRNSETPVGFLRDRGFDKNEKGAWVRG
jgi:hypothetical protein